MLRETLKESVPFYPIWWLGVLVRLPKYLRNLFRGQTDFQQQLLALKNSQDETELALRNLSNRLDDSTIQPKDDFSFVIPAEPFLERAEARLGRSVKSLAAPERQKEFYTFLSETGGADYEENLKKQFSTYLPFIPRETGRRFVDIGCGAGEFVRFLGENGISAMGIDSNEFEVTRGRARGLDVHHHGAMEFLRASTEQFSGISLIEVIEHIPFDQVAPLIELASSKLVPGGMLLVETINLRHPYALLAFYNDPTHIRPIPDDYVAFLFQWNGLRDVKIVFTSPVWVPGSLRQHRTLYYFNFAAIGYR